MSNEIKINLRNGYLTGQILIATPQIQGTCFEKSVIYICSHSKDGAMGLIVNHAVSNIKSSDLIRHLGLDFPQEKFDFPVYLGGPVEPGRGFILHSSDYKDKGTMEVDNKFSLTSNVEILHDMANGKGPQEKIIALGYAGWSAGQLEKEIEANSWISAPARWEIIFGRDNDGKWLKACRLIGVDPYMLSDVAGHA